MKRLDKPTKHGRNTLLNFQKTSNLPLKNVCASKSAEYLKSKTMFSWLHVFGAKRQTFFGNQKFYIHLKTNKNEKRLRVK